MIRLAVSGATGKMGQAVIRSAATLHSKCKVAAVLDANIQTFVANSVREIHPALEANCIKELSLTPLQGKIDVAIDFTRPEAALSYLSEALLMKLPMVIGTTGFSIAQHKQLEKAAQDIPLIVASNMSLGMNLIMHEAGKFAKALGNDYDIDIIEAHHHQKQDAPSGTAKTLGEHVVAGKGLPDLGAYPSPEEGLRQRDGYPRYHVIRSGGVIGEHRLLFTSANELIEVRHLAMNRDLFAEGALQAACWLVGQKPGFYTIQDVLGLTA